VSKAPFQHLQLTTGYLQLAVYFFTSLCIVLTRSQRQNFLSSILRSTLRLFLRDQ